ncbi:hypothetical protein LR48_Vigan11g092400 [Vigna angularis]|uniref:Uncharacterized protein n=1 Tax=Phaseolus angularis TaxID=3914 RepID=A0A0L9VS35_PHAAN|nr:hypothetical protein LR48_Vigan11g092400 [Vigna angularis]
MIWKRSQSTKELEPRKVRKSTRREGYIRLQDAWLPFYGALSSNSHASALAYPLRGVERQTPVISSFACPLRGVERQTLGTARRLVALSRALNATSHTKKADMEEKLVHQDSMYEDEELKPYKPVRYKNKLWVIKDIKENEVIEVEVPYSRRVKMVTRKLLKLCWCDEREKSTNIKNAD